MTEQIKRQDGVTNASSLPRRWQPRPALRDDLTLFDADVVQDDQPPQSPEGSQRGDQREAWLCIECRTLNEPTRRWCRVCSQYGGAA